MEGTLVPRIANLITLALIIVGGLNWFLVGVFKFDLVAAIGGGHDFGETNGFIRTIYVIVGLAAIVQ
ncbi:MAG TPA: DUF378 domain-containing protein, partial [Thermomicrobiales bacterium]|nr:DUF378 domain-containing protein [Thermomicrobiales bacterium]